MDKSQKRVGQCRDWPELRLEIFDEALEQIRTLTHLQLLDLQKILEAQTQEVQKQIQKQLGRASQDDSLLELICDRSRSTKYGLKSSFSSRSMNYSLVKFKKNWKNASQWKTNIQTSKQGWKNTQWHHQKWQYDRKVSIMWWGLYSIVPLMFFTYSTLRSFLQSLLHIVSEVTRCI